MPLTEMRALIEKRRALIEKKKRANSERAATRLKEAQCRPLGMPKEKPSHVSLIQGRFDYKTPPQELQSRLVIPHTSHETSMVNSQYISSLLCENRSPFSLQTYPDSNPTPLNLTIDPEMPVLEPEFSNSPKFLQDCETIVQQCLAETNDTADVLQPHSAFLSDNLSFYAQNVAVPQEPKCDNQENIVPLPTAVPELIDETLQQLIDVERAKYDNYVNGGSLETNEKETRLPFKKRRMSVSVTEPVKEEVSYPATRMLSIAEVAEELQICRELPPRPFKTAAERKEIPPLPTSYCNDSIIADPFHQTYNCPSVTLPSFNVHCNAYYSVNDMMPYGNTSIQKMNCYAYQEKPAARKRSGKR